MILIYDKEDRLMKFARFSKKKLEEIYIADENRLTTVFVEETKGKKITKKTIIVYDRNIQLWFFEYSPSDYLIRSIDRTPNKIQFPKVVERIETNNQDEFKLFTIKSDLINHWLDMV